MNITKIEGATPGAVYDELRTRIHDSRFAAELRHDFKAVKIGKVRTAASKLYCGNHPKACEAKIGPHKHKKLQFLEGADWVEFNDLLNDAMDAMNVACDIKSSTCVVRKGARRRVTYEANCRAPDGTWIWDLDGPDDHYLDRRGAKEPYRITVFPRGTPGIHTGQDYFCVGAHDHHHDHAH